jgi:cytochrome c553
MKRILLVIFSTAVLAFSCSKKTNATSNTSNKETAVNPVTSEVKAPDMVALGKTVYETKCGRCHALKKTDNYSAERWKEVLVNMIPKAKLNEDEAKQVTAYVNANAKK